MERITEAFYWPTRDPEWVVKVLIVGLILILPIVGAINALGWMLASLDRLRAGEERLAPANFSYLGRGVRLFVVEVVYGLVITLVAMAIYIPAIVLAVKQSEESSTNPGVIALSVLLSFAAFSVATIGSLALTFATPAIVLATDSGGIPAGINIAAVWRRCRSALTNTLIAGLMLIAASFIASLGSAACLIGIFFTSAYALAMQAWIVRSYELGSSSAGAAQQSGRRS